MKAKNITTKGILVGVLGLAILEAWTLTNKEQGDTISEVINESSKKRLYIPFLFGALMGHWFWPLKTIKKED